jgi:hypothetical protein
MWKSRCRQRNVLALPTLCCQSCRSIRRHWKQPTEREENPQPSRFSHDRFLAVVSIIRAESPVRLCTDCLDCLAAFFRYLPVALPCLSASSPFLPSFLPLHSSTLDQVCDVSRGLSSYLEAPSTPSSPSPLLPRRPPTSFPSLKVIPRQLDNNNSRSVEGINITYSARSTIPLRFHRNCRARTRCAYSPSPFPFPARIPRFLDNWDSSRLTRTLNRLYTATPRLSTPLLRHHAFVLLSPARPFLASPHFLSLLHDPR